MLLHFLEISLRLYRMLDKSRSFTGLITLIDSIGCWSVSLLLYLNFFLVIVKLVYADMTGGLQLRLDTSRVVDNYFTLLLKYRLCRLIWELGMLFLLILLFRFNEIICSFQIFTYCFCFFLSRGFLRFINRFLFSLYFNFNIWIIFVLLLILWKFQLVFLVKLLIILDFFYLLYLIRNSRWILVVYFIFHKVLILILLVFIFSRFSLHV